MYTSKNLNDWCILEVFPYKTTLVLLGKNFWASVRFSPMCANSSNFETGSSASHEYFLGFLLIPCGNVKVQQLQYGDIVRFSINEYVRILFNTWLVSGWTNPFQKYYSSPKWKSSPIFGVKIRNICKTTNQLASLAKTLLLCISSISCKAIHHWCPWRNTFITWHKGSGTEMDSLQSFDA